MNEFQILDKEGKALSMRQLDNEAAAFWGKEVDPKWYATPPVDTTGMSEVQKIRADMAGNWFDKIGWHIATVREYSGGWKDVIRTMIGESLISSFISDEKESSEKPIQVYYMTGDPEVKLELHIESEMGVYAALNYFKPYIELINHWHSKGYTPKQIKN